MNAARRLHPSARPCRSRRVRRRAPRSVRSSRALRLTLGGDFVPGALLGERRGNTLGLRAQGVVVGGHKLVWPVLGDKHGFGEAQLAGGTLEGGAQGALLLVDLQLDRVHVLGDLAEASAQLLLRLAQLAELLVLRGALALGLGKLLLGLGERLLHGGGEARDRDEHALGLGKLRTAHDGLARGLVCRLAVGFELAFEGLRAESFAARAFAQRLELQARLDLGLAGSLDSGVRVDARRGVELGAGQGLVFRERRLGRACRLLGSFDAA